MKAFLLNIIVTLIILASAATHTQSIEIPVFLRTVADLMPRAAPDDLANDIEAFLKVQAAAGFTGSVLVVQKDTAIFNRSIGLANSESPTRFWLASNSKQFTAAAILKLQEQGKLSVKNPITKFFQEVPSEKQGITIHHLLSHTSGLGTSYVAEGIQNRNEALRAILKQPLKIKVGTGYVYSNDAYNLLAIIVEMASGKKFEEYLRTELFEPAGLKNTGFWGHETAAEIAPLADSARGKRQKPTIYLNGKSVANWGYRGSGGLFSTTEDIFLWLKALRSGAVLKNESMEQMWAPQVLIRHSALQKDKDIYYGYGWGVVMVGGKRYEVNHAGEDDWLGHNGVIHSYENGNSYVVLTNSGNHADKMWSSVISEFLSEKLAQK